MSEEINCYVCGHSINKHGDGYTRSTNCSDYCEDGRYCLCSETPNGIAAYAVAQAYEQARMDYGGGDVDRFLIFAKTCNTDPAHIAKAQP